MKVKYPNSKELFFGAKLIALVKIEEVCDQLPSATQRKVLAERQKFFGSFQVECGTKRGAENSAHSFGNSIERVDNTKCSILLKLDFSNAFNSLHRETMLNHVNQIFSDLPESYKHNHCAYSKPIYLFY